VAGQSDVAGLLDLLVDGEKLEARLKQVVGLELNREQMRGDPPKQVLTEPDARQSAEAIMAEMTQLRARCQRYTKSVVTPRWMKCSIATRKP